MLQSYNLEITLDQAKLISDAVRAFKVEVPLAQLDATNTSTAYRDLIGKLKLIMESEEITPAPEVATPPVVGEPEVTTDPSVPPVEEAQNPQ